ncbi:MAG: hypothetical protein AAGU76_05200 [Sedimentibacter sp.]|uniref:hypothetical protein n=1 Tax=Sedimentibacter sp. TaxID=1960295 RepID=UPI0031593742
MGINEYFNKVYTIAFRLTGEAGAAGEMAEAAIESSSLEFSKDGEVPSVALKHAASEVMRIFLAKPEMNYVHFSADNNDTNTVCGAVLSLEPVNRVAIVWRDMLDYRIDDLAEACGYTKHGLYRELNRARMHLKTRIGEKIKNAG